MMTEVLKELRKKNNQTQEDMAKFLGIERTTYGKYETGVIQPPIDVILKVADRFDVTTDYLLGKKEKSIKYSIGDVNHGAIVQGTGTATVGQDSRISDDEAEFIRIYRNLNTRSRCKFMTVVFQLEDEEKDKQRTNALSFVEEF